MTRKLLLALAAVAVAVVALATAAAPAAHAYPPGGPQVVADKAVYEVGSPASYTASGFPASSPVDFYVKPSSSGAFVFVGTALSNASGVATLVTTAPATPGTFTLRAQSQDGAVWATTTFRVISSSGTPGTGANSQGILVVGGLAIALGLVLLVVAWRRRQPGEAFA